MPLESRVTEGPSSVTGPVYTSIGAAVALIVGLMQFAVFFSDAPANILVKLSVLAVLSLGGGIILALVVPAIWLLPLSVISCWGGLVAGLILIAMSSGGGFLCIVVSVVSIALGDAVGAYIRSRFRILR
jgi:hypothetical protein